MKLILTGGIALCALTMFAAETQQKPTTTETVIAAPPTAQVQDSPLVRAAKATGRLQKKATNVITNETLLKTGGHFTTTKSQTPVPQIPAAPVPVQPRISAAEQKRQEAAAKAKKEAADRKSAARRADADFNDDSIEPRFEDPAMQEHVMQQDAPPATTTAQPPKPPGL